MNFKENYFSYEPGLIETQVLEKWALNNKHFITQTNFNDVWVKETDEGVCFTLTGGRNNGLRLSGIISCDSDGWKMGIHDGFLNFPVPILRWGFMANEVMEIILSKIKRIEEKEMIFLNEHDFGPGSGRGEFMYHYNGWYMRDRFMYEFKLKDVFKDNEGPGSDADVLSKLWGDAKFFRLRNYVYIVFPKQKDGSRNYRLVPARDFFNKRHFLCPSIPFAEPMKNQGDLWIYSIEKKRLTTCTSTREIIENFDEIENKVTLNAWKEEKEKYDFWGHIITPDPDSDPVQLWIIDNDPTWIAVNGKFYLNHNVHEKEYINSNDYIFLLKMAPGTSHPFQRGVDD